MGLTSAAVCGVYSAGCSCDSAGIVGYRIYLLPHTYLPAQRIADHYYCSDCTNKTQCWEIEIAIPILNRGFPDLLEIDIPFFKNRFSIPNRDRDRKIFHLPSQLKPYLSA